jgi:hypothetical protein
LYKQTGYAFYGNGTTNGLNFKDSGKALIMHRDGGATYIQGNAVITTDNSSEKASHTFQEIGHSSPDGTIKPNGAAFLNNVVVAIYQRTDIYKAGNSKLIAWK